MAVVDALVAGQTGRGDERLVIWSVCGCGRAVVLVCGDAHRVPDRRASSSAHMASISSARGDRLVDVGRR